MLLPQFSDCGVARCAGVVVIIRGGGGGNRLAFMTLAVAEGCGRRARQSRWMCPGRPQR